MKILLAVDDSMFSEAATQAVIAQARPKETEIQVLHVLEPMLEVIGNMEKGYVVDWQAVTRARRVEAESLVVRAAKALRDAGFQAAKTIEEGNPKSVIIDSAKKWPADLIVLGPHGRKGVERFLLGSVSDAVARHAPCSVQIVRSSATSDNAAAV